MKLRCREEYYFLITFCIFFIFIIFIGIWLGFSSFYLVQILLRLGNLFPSYDFPSSFHSDFFSLSTWSTGK